MAIRHGARGGREAKRIAKQERFEGGLYERGVLTRPEDVRMRVQAEAAQVDGFDYGTLDAETRIVVQQRTSEIKDLVRSTAENIVRIGERLSEVQERLAKYHGGTYGNWLKTEFGWSKSTAYNFIAVYLKFGSFPNFGNLNIATSALYLLAAPSTPEEIRQDAITRAESGETITFSDVKRSLSDYEVRLKRDDEYPNRSIEETDAPLVQLVMRPTTGAHVISHQLSRQQEALDEALQATNPEVKAIVVKYGVTSAWRVEFLNRMQKNGSKKWQEVVSAEGWLQPGEESEAVNIFTELNDVKVKEADELYNRRTAIEALEKRHQMAAEAPLPEGKYRVIYADPPWQYGNTMPDYFTEQGDHYPLMALDDICAMPVKDIAANNAVLFLWVTSPILEESFEVIKAWDFKYKASFVWDKVKHNMGHYNSVRHEFLLICTRGSCQPDVARLFDSVVSEERTRHSEKPESFRQIIDTIYPHGRRIELFARKEVEGWDAYGNEVPSR